MRLWAACVYTIVYAILCCFGAALTSKVERTIRLAGSELRYGKPRATAFQTFLRWCLYVLPPAIFACTAAVWISYAAGSAVGYGVGVVPAALILMPGVFWHCIAHDASPDLRTGTDVPRPHPVILATVDGRTVL